MTYKNWDDVRDHRIYAYLNQHELELFLQAMKERKLTQKATAARTFIVEHSHHVLYAPATDAPFDDVITYTVMGYQ